MYIQYIYISQLLYALYLPSHHYSTSVLFFFFFFQILYLYLSSKSDILFNFFIHLLHKDI